MEAGHFVGFYTAVLGTGALLLWLSQKSAQEKLGRWRIPFGLIVGVLLLLLGVFANGRRTLSYQAVLGPREGIPAGLSQSDLDRAKQDLASAAFLDYCASITGSSAIEKHARLSQAISMQPLLAGELRDAGIRLEPAPAPGEMFLKMTYQDSEPALFAALDGGDGVRRLKLLASLAEPILPELVFFAHIENIPTDDEKANLLEGARWQTPRAAEWMVARLDEMAKTASPALATVIARKRAFLQQYVEEPSLRGLPEGVRPTL